MIPFSIARLPRIEFGRGRIDLLPEIVSQYGENILLVTGGASMKNSPHWETLQNGFKKQNIQFAQCSIPGEPSPQLVDAIVAEHQNTAFDAVVGIGGGSALDAAKAIAGLLRIKCSVMDFLEGVGPQLPYPGPAVPLIAVPTTAGTGSEATKNAVLSVQGAQGFKKSFRHDKLVAEYAIIDPQLLETCPKEVIAANGMDALTQLIESIVSTKSNVFTDALAISGLKAVRDGLLAWYDEGAQAQEAQNNMAYAALISGITLAQVGLGSVHGLASPLGAFYPIPHGIVCGTLVAKATQTNIDSMKSREPENPALEKYALIGEVMCQTKFKNLNDAHDALLELLDQWTRHMHLPMLSKYGLVQDAIDNVVAHSRGSSMKTNPIVLTDEEIKQIVLSRF